MCRIGTKASARRSRDAGFTLVEVVVALAVLSLVSTAGLYFFVNGTRSITHQQRSQNAVAVANEAMERAYSVNPGRDAVAEPFGLVAGRSQASVNAAWSAAATLGTEGLSDTYPVWDPTVAAMASPPPAALELTTHTKLSGMPYDVTTLVGTCYRVLTTASTSAPCSTITGVGADPGTVPVGYAQLLRVMVVVTWEPTAGECSSGVCSYQLTALIDPSADLAWNNTTVPIAVDDSAIVMVGESVTITVITNDIIGPVVTNPVQKVLVKTGTGTVALQADGTVKFQAPSNASGLMTFTYSLKDGQGRESNAATVTVSVMPKAVNDTAAAVKNTPVSIPVTANDLGTPASVTITTPPTTGTATASGTNVVYNPGAHVGTFTFGYTFTDASGLVSTPAVVTVVVTTYAPPKVADLMVAIPATVGATRTDLNMLSITGNPSGYLIEIMSTSVTQGQLVVGGSNYNSANNRISGSIAYTQQGNTLGIFTFAYRVLTPDKTVASETKTITLVIMPTPQNDSFSVRKNTSGNDLAIGANDAPMNFGGTTQFALRTISAPTCGSLPPSQPNLQNGRLLYNAPKSSGTCTFQYQIQGTGAYASLMSAAATVTVTVTDR